jgi:hypothetical protein
LNINDPAHPVHIQTLDTPVNARGIGFYNDFILVADDGMLLILYYEDINGIDDDYHRLPSNFSIVNCYPNPFNPSTTIDFELKKRGHINLDIYDIQGKHVSRLASGQYESGRYSLNWNADGLPSGIYFLKLSGKSPSGNRDIESTAKLIYLK